MHDIRQLLAALAYRMLGSVRQAEDICHDAALQQGRASDGPADPSAGDVWAKTTRLAIEHLKLAQLRRAEYVGECLPAPLVESQEHWSESSFTESDTLSLSFLRCLDVLDPVSRAVFLLHDVFDRPLSHVAAIVRESETACRGILDHGRAYIGAARPRFHRTAATRRAIAGQFFDGISRFDGRAVSGVLALDAVGYVDGGGKVAAWPCPIAGRDAIARVFLGVGSVMRSAGLGLQAVSVNGQPGAVLTDPAGRLIDVIALDVIDGAVRTVYSVVNPDKLAHLGEVGDARALFRAAPYS